MRISAWCPYLYERGRGEARTAPSAVVIGCETNAVTTTACFTVTSPRARLSTRNRRKKRNSPDSQADIVSYDSFAGLRGDRIPPHVKDGREMVDAVAAWALPGTLSFIPLDVLLAAVGALMCEFQVCFSIC